jgi:Aspartyl protease
MKLYYLAVRSGLLFTRAALKQQTLLRVITLLLDSGSSYTILSWGTISSLGLDPGASTIRRPVMTANGEFCYWRLRSKSATLWGNAWGNSLC